MRDSDVLALLGSMGVTVNFWHIADAGKDSVDLLDRLINTYGPGPNYFVVKNEGRGSDFSLLDNSAALKKTLALGGQVVTLGQLHEGSMRKIDRRNASFWAAIHTTERPRRPGHAGAPARQNLVAQHLRHASTPCPCSEAASLT